MPVGPGEGQNLVRDQYGSESVGAGVSSSKRRTVVNVVFTAGKKSRVAPLFTHIVFSKNLIGIVGKVK